MMTLACYATCYHLATDDIDVRTIVYTTLDLTIISNILEARISLPQLSDVEDTLQRNNAPAAQARIRRLKHHTQTLLASTFHYPDVSQVLQQLAGASEKSHLLSSEKTLRSVNSFGFDTSHLFDRILKPSTRTDKAEKSGGRSFTHRNVSMTLQVHWCCRTLMPLHVSEILASIATNAYMDQIIST